MCYLELLDKRRGIWALKLAQIPRWLFDVVCKLQVLNLFRSCNTETVLHEDQRTTYFIAKVFAFLRNVVGPLSDSRRFLVDVCDPLE